MRRIKLSKYEKWIEGHADEYVPVSKEDHQSIADIIKSYRKNAVLNIRVNSTDLQCLKDKAKKLGVKYQTFISQILHQVAQS